MKKLLIMLVGGAMMMSSTTLSGADFFVSPNGSDSNSGSEAKPFATLDAARDAIRRLPPDAKSRGVTVWIGSGSYMLSDTFDLDSRDSGSEGAPIVYRAEKDANVTLLGGVLIAPEAFIPVKDQAIIGRLDESARGKVLQFALPKQGTTEAREKVLPVTNELVNGSMFSMRLPVPELFFNGEELPFSKWPNTGFAKYGKVIDAGSVPRFGDKSNRPGTFEYTDARPERWTKAEHIFIHGYFAEDWFDDVLTVGNLDIQQRRITFTTPHMYGLKPNMRYRALGLLEEIDQPGEWMVDHKAGILYLYPPADMAKGQFALSMLKTPMIRMKQTQHVTFLDLNLEVTQGTCVDIAGGTDNLIAGCTIRNVGGCGILIRPVDHEVKDPGGLHQFRKESGDPLKDGRRNGVVGCTLYNIGNTGISMLGGDRETLAPSKHYAVNNDIHHYARRQRANQPAINMSGVGQRAAHNYIHDAPHVGLDYSGNDHLIEYNELTRLCLETGDVGAIYSGRNWTYRGNVVRYNYIHHIQGPGKHGSMAVYLDDSCSSTHLYGNVFHKVQRAAFIGGGRDNTVENNIFVDVSLAVYLDNRSEGWALKYQKPGGDHRMYEKLKEVNHDKPPYSTRYPELARILDETPHKPLGNKVLNNICVRSKWVGGGAEGSLQIKQNLVTDSDPGFRNLEALDFSFKDIAEIQKQLPEFKPIPFEMIGLQSDAYRKIPLQTPQVTPAQGIFRDAITVTLSPSARDSGRAVVVRYTTDGSEPTQDSPVATKPLVLKETTTVKAWAFVKDGSVPASPVVTARYEKTDMMYLSLLPETDARVHNGLKKNMNYAGSGPVSLGGKQYANSLLMHPAQPDGRAYVTYPLAGLLQGAARFRAQIGIDDAMAARGSVVFIVEVSRNGKWTEAFRSPVLRGGKGSVPVEVDITGAEALRLVTADAGDGMSADHAVWADARIEAGAVAIPKPAVQDLKPPMGSVLWYTKPAESWMMEALPIGNGRLGAMFFGGVGSERLQFNEDSLWSGYPDRTEITPDGRAWMEQLQTLLAEGKVVEASRLKRPPCDTASMDAFGAYQPFGDILIEAVGHTGAAPQAYRRSLDLGNALGQVQYGVDGVTYSREYFSSFPDSVLVGRLAADADGKLDINIKLTCPHEATLANEGDDTIVFSGAMPKSGQKFAARLLIRATGATGGTAKAGKAGTIEVRDADAVELLLDAHTDYAMTWPECRRDVDPIELCRETIAKAAKKSYDELKRAHVADHRALFDRVRLDLPAPDDRNSLPTDQRLIAYNEGAEGGTPKGGDPGLEALVFQMGRYMMIASSRPGALPTNLQGLWNDSKTPPWNSDYHTDINIQMNYWVNGPTALPECFEPFTRYLAFLRSASRNTANKWFGTDGLFVHIYTNPWGYSGLRWMWTGGAGWMCQNLYDQFLFTGDMKFLAEQAYPLMKDACVFYEAVLREYHKGGLVVTPSLSPENFFKHPQASELRMCAGAAIDQQIVYEIFTHTAEAACILGKDEDLAKRLIDLRDKLSQPVKIGANGAVQEWIEDWPPTDALHRHLSHLYALYPGNQIDPLTTPEWAAAARKALEIRTKRRSTGWGLAWQVALYARLHDDARAHTILRQLLRRCRMTATDYSAGGIYDNLFSTHAPFQIDANFGATAAVAEMLLQSQRGNWRDGYEIHLLPALPRAWPKGQVTGLRARGGFVVDLDWNDGQLSGATIESLTGQPCRVRYCNKVLTLTIPKGETKTLNPEDFEHAPEEK